jgi:hypothetical protein
MRILFSGVDLQPGDYQRTSSIDIQLERLTPMSELPRSGRMSLGRRFNAGAGALPGVETPG